MADVHITSVSKNIDEKNDSEDGETSLHSESYEDLTSSEDEEFLCSESEDSDSTEENEHAGSESDTSDEVSSKLKHSNQWNLKISVEESVMNSTLESVFMSGRSKSETNLSDLKYSKKKLPFENDVLNDAISTQSSFFSSIRNWFRGTSHSAKNNSLTEHNAKEGVVKKQEHMQSILKSPSPFPQKAEVGTAFGRYKESPQSTKKVIKFSESFISNSSRDYDSETSSTASFSSECDNTSSNAKNDDLPSEQLKADDFETSSEATTNVSDTGKTIYYLRSCDEIQCVSWQRVFKRCPRVKVEQKDIDVEIHSDAMIIPGNSFGFCDGEPEIRYVEIFGWRMQTKLRQLISEKYDGELLVGEAAIFPFNIADSTAAEEISESVEEKMPSIVNEEPVLTRNTIRYIVYVPVMRVPSLVSDTVNAYLAFRAAIRAVNAHNTSCDVEEKISSVISPALCSGIGGMPPVRVAHQMKTAYDTFELNKRPDLRRPGDLGKLASCHVEMSSVKNGRWC